MNELRCNNREYVQRLQELRRGYQDMLRLADLVSDKPLSAEDVEAAETAYYEWKWLPSGQDAWSDHRLWQANVALAKRCAKLDAGMTSLECYRADVYATNTTGVWGPQDFPEQTSLSDERERHHYLCAWLVAALGVTT